MASTILISRTITVARRFINQYPLVVDTIDPALTMGDWVRQFILSPPFTWRWNRAVIAPFALAAGTQDYAKAVADFGWIEQATLVDTTVSPNVSYQLEVVLDLGEEKTSNLPTKIAPQLDDDSGNITFRLFPPPDKAYTLNITYQKAAPIFVATTDTWAPIPDYFSYLYTSGFLAKSYEYFGDERFPAAMQLFVRQLSAANGGLSDSQINIFLGDQINSQRTTDSQLQSSQMARQGRNLV
jgi:hypothetical protein